MKFLYHANCNDGHGAALAAWMKFGDDGHEYIPVQYGDQPPNITPGDTVYILDFSYPREILKEMANVAKNIIVLDHHKTARDDLSAPFDEHNILTVFNMDKSGAVLAWEMFHQDKPLPELFAYIQDRDLWRFDLDGTNEVSYGLSVLSDNFRHWAQLADNPDLIQIRTRKDGRAIIRFLEINAEKITNTPPVMFEITGDCVPVYNIPGFMISDTLHMALEKHKEARYAVGYFDLPEGKRVYSLRSRNGTDVDVSEIARTHGGGGHKHAAGFSVKK